MVGLVLTIIFIIVPNFKDPLATQRDIQKFVINLQSKPENPSQKEVERDLEREFKAAFKKKKKSALEEYRHGNEAYTKSLLNVAVNHFRKALSIVEIPSFNLALGNCFFVLGQYELALNHYNRSLRQSRSNNNKKIEGSALDNIGNIYQYKGDLNEALKYLRQALEICRRFGYKQGEAINLGNIGNIYIKKGDLDEALIYDRQALEICKGIGYKQGEANMLDNIGIIYSEKGDLDEALKYFRQALAILYTAETLLKTTSSLFITENQRGITLNKR